MRHVERLLPWLGLMAAMASPATGQWQRGAWLPIGHSGHAMAYDAARGVTVLFGGSETQINIESSTREWDGARWVTRSPATRPAKRFDHRMVYHARRGTVVLFTDRTLALSGVLSTLGAGTGEKSAAEHCG